ncbi:P-loop containing nucleoside triphosphate hydrolase protein [Amylostereum chailletii]|nr:P-loop containing nucleoside triphosphate hydrolase protein [Amylostereum chailletii]
MRAFSSSKPASGSSSHRAPRGFRSNKAGSSKPSGSKGGQSSKANKETALPQPDGPVHDFNYIKETYQTRPLKKTLEDNPKSPLSNWLKAYEHNPPAYKLQEINLNGKRGYRATIAIENSPPIIGVGDSLNKKEAEQLAALCAVHQLNSQGKLDPPKNTSSEPIISQAAPASLSDGSVVTSERARQFMDYYCRRYGFGRPEITFNDLKSRGRNTWEAVMNVNGRRIGIGTGINKKVAQSNCFVDVTQYLESCDPGLWKTFLQAAADGKDLGLAPKVLLDMSDRLEDEVRDLCIEVRDSKLYQNRPSSKVSPSDPVSKSTSTSAVYRRPIPVDFIASKSERLLEQRKAYLSNPQMDKMRETRSTLPVFTRAEDVLHRVRDNEVTICMAATGSGKTTQIPQIILDDYIERGEGAKCNIVCTQPRRIAAISVAERVARERGEVAGPRSSVGYQVRFESKLPEEHGSITFCTTGIFLRRMQSALQENIISRGMNMEDVTHVIVDEVHERDVDTDLLLVVLKRLLADRKAKGKPIKVILMSATIDPTLFQQYFPDDLGRPANVVEVPGRSFPVEKHYLDDFLPELVSDRRNSWVFADDTVIKYSQQELGSSASAILSGRAPVGPPQPEESRRNDDLDLPYPLVALVIAHVLKKSDDGHVLVFLPGWDEIQAVNRFLGDGRLGLPLTDTNQYTIHLLHSSIPVAEQQVIFEPPPKGVRRIILSTNIAETSVTIPDVVYVVDTGKIKEQRYDPDRHMSALVSAWVGSSNLNQRAGRAGRHRSGEYYGIIGKKRVAQLHPHQTVEMKRVDLTNVVMHVKALDFPGMAVEDVLAATIEPPASDRIAAAMSDLQMVGAIDRDQNLTPLGRVLLQLPVEVQVGRMVLFGSFFRCLDQAVTLAAILTNRDPFLSPMHLKVEAASVKDSWTSREFRSDVLAVLQAYNAWWDMQKRGDYYPANRFCSDNFLSKPTLLMIEKIKQHLLASLHQAGVLDVSAGGRAEVYSRGKDLVIPPELNVNGDSLPLLAALIASASQPNFAIKTSDKAYRTQRDKTVFIHPSSVNHRRRDFSGETRDGAVVDKQIIAFAEKRQNISAAGSSSNNAPVSLISTTRLDPMTYVLFGAYRTSVTERGLECDDWLPIVGNVYALDDLQRLKTMMEGCMSRVFEGLLMRRRRHRSFAPVAPREEEEDGDEDDGKQKDYSLSEREIKDLDYLTRDIVRILNRYAEERIATQSRANSRPGTPMASPALSGIRLPPVGSRSGQSTPYGSRSAYNSRPGTPSRLSRPLR